MENIGGGEEIRISFSYLSSIPQPSSGVRAGVVLGQMSVT